jgi:hypothetical protein
MLSPDGWWLEARLYSPASNKTRATQAQVNRHQEVDKSCMTLERYLD